MMDFAGGWEIFAVFLVVFTLAVVYSFYTRRGSGINQRPFADQYDSAAGARGPSRISGRDGNEAWTRGTR
jgi:hypothetical protein